MKPVKRIVEAVVQMVAEQIALVCVRVTVVAIVEMVVKTVAQQTARVVVEQVAIKVA